MVLSHFCKQKRDSLRSWERTWCNLFFGKSKIQSISLFENWSEENTVTVNRKFLDQFVSTSKTKG